MSKQLDGPKLEELRRRAAGGDNSAEALLLEHLSVRFLLIAKHYIGAEAAGDVAQNACVAVLKKYRTETFSVSFAAWCQGVLKLSVRDHYKKTGRQAERETRLEFASAVAGRTGTPGLIAALRDCLRGVLEKSRNYARVLNLTHQGYETEEICRRLSVSPNHYYVLLSRARAQLKACLADKGFAV